MSRLSAKQIELLNVFLSHDLAYVANPTGLRKDSYGRVTIAEAREICERLAKVGILKVDGRRSKKQEWGTRHYRLDTTAKGFRAFVNEYSGTLSRIAGPRWLELSHPLFNSAYGRSQLTSDFVRGILAAKGVEVRYSINKKDGTPQLADGRLRLGPSAFPDAEEIAFLCFPVRPPAVAIDDLKKRVHSFGGTDLPEASLFNRVVQRHYAEMEDRLLVLPVLGLVQTSPTALLEFLDDWKPFDPDYMGGGHGIEMVQHLIFRLVFDAVGDLAITRDVPEGLDVTSAVVRPEHAWLSATSLPSFKCRGGTTRSLDSKLDSIQCTSTSAAKTRAPRILSKPQETRKTAGFAFGGIATHLSSRRESKRGSDTHSRIEPCSNGPSRIIRCPGRPGSRVSS